MHEFVLCRTLVANVAGFFFPLKHVSMVAKPLITLHCDNFWAHGAPTQMVK